MWLHVPLGAARETLTSLANFAKLKTFFVKVYPAKNSKKVILESKSHEILPCLENVYFESG